ncbi:MAG: DNA repair protein RadC [Gammaproteobacteria bacterium]|nr:DNA repair protein RadC [Gammaproteobacteria bacterium]NCF82408.1 DNA repair protein RadC [Pseudomonadota bacterium]
MGIKHWPAVERPREKLLARGAQALSDAELLAIFIGSGIAGHTALDLSRLLLARFGDLRATLDANHEEFCRTPGVGDACYALLQAALELGRRYLECRIRRGTPLGCPADTRRFLTARLRSHEHEVFACLFLDNRHRLICFEELFRGTVNGASVYPREIAKRGLYHNAAAIIIAHNHPSGVAEPSQADRAITGRIRDAMALIDVRLMDHFVVGDGQIVSFAERGWI